MTWTLFFQIAGLMLVATFCLMVLLNSVNFQIFKGDEQ